MFSRHEKRQNFKAMPTRLQAHTHKSIGEGWKPCLRNKTNRIIEKSQLSSIKTSKREREKTREKKIEKESKKNKHFTSNYTLSSEYLQA